MTVISEWKYMRASGKLVIISVSVVILLAIISILVGLFSSLGLGESFRIVYGSLYVLFLPGFILSYIFFPKTKNEEEKYAEETDKGIDWIERIALSFALSIAVVPLVIFYLNLIGLTISLINSFFTILAIIIISVVILFWKNKRKY